MNTASYVRSPVEREALLRRLAGVTFVIFFQAYMVAPIVPALSHIFAAPQTAVAHIVPAYLIPYGVATLIYGLLASSGLRANAARSYSWATAKRACVV